MEKMDLNEAEDGDIGCYFLQPSATPYNIIEKLQQANFELFNSTPQAIKSSKVKFRDELVSFEPELTDDDVNSIESDHVVDELPQQIVAKNDEVLYNTVVQENVDIYDTIEEEIEETVFDELVLSDIEVDKNNSNEEILMEKKISPIIINEDKSKTKHSKRKNKSTLKKQDIHCKEHCIERLDTHLSMSIKKLEIHEKTPVNLPPLQLHQRKCCDNLKQSNTDRNLPNYKGYRSEYGLSSRQIKNRDRYMEMLRQKELSRQKLIEDYRALRVQQNEEVFCQWLKKVSKRGKDEQQINFLSPNVDKAKERPKTAGFTPKTTIKKKKRPHTSQSCVYIEVSPSVLKKGINIGDLLITNSKALTKKLHILTV
ncbi:unnamed protein product [Ceutorhynchus assimilis]|uniref:Coiled-coil domain-containing protein 181 n=1 Tax=Ceutorhynchus assimilis TaxID=467358 RepID=A0A9N9QSV9_9CUCU|nr:unnamed protein product [Ceutorhynchus assimilis]